MAESGLVGFLKCCTFYTWWPVVAHFGLSVGKLCTPMITYDDFSFCKSSQITAFLYFSPLSFESTFLASVKTISPNVLQQSPFNGTIQSKEHVRTARLRVHFSAQSFFLISHVTNCLIAHENGDSSILADNERQINVHHGKLCGNTALTARRRCNWSGSSLSSNFCS